MTDATASKTPAHGSPAGSTQEYRTKHHSTFASRVTPPCATVGGGSLRKAKALGFSMTPMNSPLILVPEGAKQARSSACRYLRHVTHVTGEGARHGVAVTLDTLQTVQAKEPDMGHGVLTGRATRATRKPTRKPRAS